MTRLATPRGIRRIGTLVFDVDRTLTGPSLRVHASTLACLRRVKARCVRLVLATGRPAIEVVRRRWAAMFDAIILEGGGLAGPPDRLKRLGADPNHWEKLKARLARHLVALRAGRTCVSVSIQAERLVRQVAKGWWIHRNGDRLDVTGQGVDKGAALGWLRRAGPRGLGGILAFADGANDLGLFAEADHCVAVANAAPSLARQADESTSDYGERGVVAFLATLEAEA